MGIEDILKQKDEKRGRGDGRQDAYEREFQARFEYSERVAMTLLASLVALRDRAIGEPVRLPIASKQSETPVFIECEGLVRLTLLCHVRADMAGTVYCSVVDLGMSRNGGRIVRSTYAPVAPKSGGRIGKLGVTEKQFSVDQAAFKTAIEALAHQL